MTRYVKYDIKQCSDLNLRRLSAFFHTWWWIDLKKKKILLWQIKVQGGHTVIDQVAAGCWWVVTWADLVGWVLQCVCIWPPGKRGVTLLLFLVSKTTVLNSIFFNGTTQKIILSARRLFWIEHILMPQLFYWSFFNWLFLNPWIVSSTI